MRIIQIIILTLFFLSSCRSSVNNKAINTFQCDQYWIKKNTEWKPALDDVKYCENEMIIRSKDSTWGIIFPGTMTLDNDTIYVNREAGYPNTCYRFGDVNNGDSIIVEVFEQKEKFRVINDTIVEYSGMKFIKTNKIIINGCWCNWK